MSKKLLWNSIKIEVPNDMVNITKKDKVVVKNTLTKTNNISKSNKEPSIIIFQVILINQKLLIMVKNGILKN